MRLCRRLNLAGGGAVSGDVEVFVTLGKDAVSDPEPTPNDGLGRMRGLLENKTGR